MDATTGDFTGILHFATTDLASVSDVNLNSAGEVYLTVAYKGVLSAPGLPATPPSSDWADMAVKVDGLDNMIIWSTPLVSDTELVSTYASTVDPTNGDFYLTGEWRGGTCVLQWRHLTHPPPPPQLRLVPHKAFLSVVCTHGPLSYCDAANLIVDNGAVTISGCGGGGRFFVVKLDATGAALWAVCAYSNGYAFGQSIAVDPVTKDVYVAGQAGGTPFTVSSGSQPSAACPEIVGDSAPIFKLDSSGNAIWVGCYGGVGGNPNIYSNAPVTYFDTLSRTVYMVR